MKYLILLAISLLAVGCVDVREDQALTHVEIFWQYDNLAASSGSIATIVVETDFENGPSAVAAYADQRLLLEDVSTGAGGNLILRAEAQDGTLRFSDTTSLAGLTSHELYYSVIDTSGHLTELAKFPSDQTPPESMYTIGRIYYDADLLTAALSWFAGLTTQYPGDSATTGKAWYYLGRCHYRLGNVAGALPEFKTVWVNYPASTYNDDALYYLAMSYYDVGMYDSSDKYLDIYATGYPQESNREKVLYSAARSLYEKGHYDSAAVEFTTLLSEFPSSAYSDEARYYLGRSNFALNRFDLALSALTTYTQSYPQGSYIDESWYYRARSFYELARYDSSSHAFGRFITTFAQSSYVDEAWYYRGRSDYEQGLYDSSMSSLGYYVRTWAQGSLGDNAQLYLGLSYYELADYTVAKVELLKVKQNYPSTTLLTGLWNYHVGRSCRYLGDHAGAVMYFDTVVTYYPTSFYCDYSYLYLIRSLLDQGVGVPNTLCSNARTYLTRMQTAFPATDQQVIDAVAEFQTHGCN